MYQWEGSLTKRQAEKLFRERRGALRPVQYLHQFDADLVYRQGKKDDPRLARIRYKEDDRPEQVFNRRLNQHLPKTVEIITYRHASDTWVLARSGGVSLFDGPASNLRLGKNDRWWILTRRAKLPEGLVIAKDKQVRSDGLYHYAIQPDRDMPVREFQEKLRKLEKHMTVFRA